MNDRPQGIDGKGLPSGLTLRALVPNAITAGALCVGLTGIRFAIGGEFAKAVLFVIAAGMLDGIDGRIARMLNAQSRFGAELDSLADSINFGVAPALILYLWSLQEMPRLGWFAALAFAICCVLFRDPLLVGIWLVLNAFLLISALPTLAWGKLAPRRSMRLPVIVLVALLVAGLVNEPWLTLVVICVGYLALIPVGIVSYARVKRQRAARAAPPPAG